MRTGLRAILGGPPVDLERSDPGSTSAETTGVDVVAPVAAAPAPEAQAASDAGTTTPRVEPPEAVEAPRASVSEVSAKVDGFAAVSVPAPAAPPLPVITAPETRTPVVTGAELADVAGLRPPLPSAQPTRPVPRQSTNAALIEHQRLQSRVGTIEQPYLRQRDNQPTRKLGVVLSVEVTEALQIHCVQTRQRTNVFIEQAIVAALEAQQASRRR